MICAADELGIGSDHSGILVLPDATLVGTSSREVLQLENDYVIEIGLTPNRSDATNHIVVAKDLAAALKINAGHKGELRLPDVSAFKTDNHCLPVEVVVENYEACPRYAGVVIGGLTIAESPEWVAPPPESNWGASDQQCGGCDQFCPGTNWGNPCTLSIWMKSPAGK